MDKIKEYMSKAKVWASEHKALSIFIVIVVIAIMAMGGANAKAEDQCLTVTKINVMYPGINAEYAKYPGMDVKKWIDFFSNHGDGFEAYVPPHFDDIQIINVKGAQVVIAFLENGCIVRSIGTDRQAFLYKMSQYMRGA